MARKSPPDKSNPVIDHNQLFDMVASFRKHLYYIVLSNTKDPNFADEIASITTEKALVAIKKGKYFEKNKLKQWLGRIAYTAFIDNFRSLKRDQRIISRAKSEFESIAIPDEFGNIESKKWSKEDYTELKNAIYSLPEDQRDVIIMRYFMELPFKKIAAITQVSVNTAIGRSRYALMNLRENFNLDKFILINKKKSLSAAA